MLLSEAILSPLVKLRVWGRPTNETKSSAHLAKL